MKRRKWDGKIKATVVLQGLKRKQVITICQEYQINQAQYYQWPESVSSECNEDV
jgi:transposase-like protein